MPRTLEERFWTKVNKCAANGCWEWTGSLDFASYGQMSAGRRGLHPMKAHRVSWMINRGPIPDGLWVLHKCDNPKCVNPDHLFLGSPKDNSQDMVKKGRCKHGVVHYQAKLNDHTVVEIRKRAKAGEGNMSLAAEYGVSRQCICHVVAGRTWKHVTASEVPAS